MNFTPKKPLVYLCEDCNFKCGNKKDYKRHLLTAKHNIRTIRTEKNPKKPLVYDCKCGKTYKSRSSLWYHNKKCSLINESTTVQENQEDKPSIMDIITQNKEHAFLELMSKNNELMNLLQEQTKNVNKLTKTVNDMIPKIGNNNTTNNNTNNQFNLQVFLNEDCKDAINFSDFIKQIQVSFEDLENQAESGYVKGISKLFIENLKELGTNKRPIHCTDKKRKTLYIKENNEWDKEGSQDTLKNGIQEITKITMRTLIKEKEDKAEEYSDMDSVFSMKCIDIQRNLFPTAPRETSFSKVMENITKNSGIIEANGKN